MRGRPLFLLLGFFFVGLGALGVALPLLPTTPFVLLAAACFARSSERWHAWLLNTRLFGPLILDWQQKRCVTRRVKVIAVLTILVFGGWSLWRLESLAWQVTGLILLTIGMTVVLSLKTCPSSDGQKSI